MEEQNNPSPTPAPETKEELVSKIEEIHKQEDSALLSMLNEVEELESRFQAIVEGIQEKEKAAFREQLEAGKIDNPTAVYEYQKEDTDHRFTELLNLIQDRVEARKKAEKEERERIRTEKEGLLQELRKLIDEEDRIGKAFQRFEEIRAKWKELSEASSSGHRDLQQEYGQLLDKFFYNIKIYKDLRELDLQKNQEMKEDVIRRIQALEKENSIHQVELLIRALQDEWNETGPTFDHVWEDLKNRYWTAVKTVYDKIREHYDEVRKQHEENRKLKELLIEKVQSIVNTERSSVKSWNKATDTVIDIQGAWKRIGFIRRNENEKLWEEFRSTCDAFFEKKSKFFESLRSEQSKHKERKEKLLEKAVELKDSTDWKNTADQLKRLQKQWKETPSAHQKDERRLWQEFRAACDHFFESRKAFFDSIGDRVKEAENQCNQLIGDVKEFTKGDDLKADLQRVEDLLVNWYAIEFKPKEKVKELNQSFQTEVDKLLSALETSKHDIAELRYRAKVKGFGQTDRASDLLKKELERIKNDIQTKKDEIIQYQNNLDFFGQSKGVEKLRAEVEKNIEKLKSQLEKLQGFKSIVQDAMQKEPKAN